MSTYNLCFDQKYEKYLNFYLKVFIFWWLKCSVYLNRRVFVMSVKKEHHSKYTGCVICDTITLISVKLK